MRCLVGLFLPFYPGGLTVPNAHAWIATVPAPCLRRPWHLESSGHKYRPPYTLLHTGHVHEPDPTKTCH